MVGKKSMLRRISESTSARFLILTARDARRAYDVAAIGGGTDRQCNDYYDIYLACRDRCKAVAPGREDECDDYLNRGDVS